MKHQALIDRMTLEERVALLSGATFFATQAFAHHDIPSILMADGPHGLRKPESTADNLGINQSLPATCFPTASLSACSWDPALLREMGAAIGAEAQQAGVDVVLGPGVNIKRNPLCGRNFEYFSEDPYLSGELGAAWIEGVQSQGVGTSLKHFAANNQENLRMASDSVVDERTLREIYLPAFETAVKRARPTTLMCAYNKLNGVYCSDNTRLLRSILREEWGFAGVIVTDWGAMNDRVQSLEAGLDLEMPNSRGCFDEEVREAVRSGRLAETRLNESVDRLLELAFTARAQRRPGLQVDAEAHHQLAKKIALNAAVLLQNEDNLLPLRPGQRIALIGALAKEPRYQGAGSSHINPTRLDSLVDGFDALGLETTYLPGYPLKGEGDPALLSQAVEAARGCDVAVIVAGLPESYESEGFDRASLAMPDSHNRLIAAVAAANPNVAVVLVGGAPVEMPWQPRVKAVLNLYLSGQAGGLAAAELLTGRANPCGKLAESYPLVYADVPSAGWFETGGRQAQYREVVYVGYRYYDKAQKAVRFPFGHGLTYTRFDYDGLQVSTPDPGSPYALEVSLRVQNAGSLDGAEVVQLYVGELRRPNDRPEKELRRFAKLFLQAGETQTMRFTLDARCFARYDVQAGDWVVPGGDYCIQLGASSRDIRLQAVVTLPGAPAADSPAPEWYRSLHGAPTQADFEALLGRPIQAVKIPRKGEYTLDCTFQDMSDSLVVRGIVQSIRSTIAKGYGPDPEHDPTYKMMIASALNTPMKNVSLVSADRMPRNVTKAIVHLANGRLLQALAAFRKKKG